MRITGTTRVYAILGDPVAQVRAPELYNRLFELHGVDAVLVPLKVSPAALPGFVEHAMRAENLAGLWATIPHKETLARLVELDDPVARVTGAVNAVRRGANGRLEGALFDGIGFVRGLDHFGIALKGRRVLVVGAGGGGCAVAAAMLQRGPALLAVANRTPERAQALVARLRGLGGTTPCEVASADPAGYDLIVNCTSQGLKPGDALPFDPERVDSGAAVVDIIMSSPPTPVVRACRERGIRAEPGFEMLTQQVPLYLRYFGYDPIAQAVEADLSGVREWLQAR